MIYFFWKRFIRTFQSKDSILIVIDSFHHCEGVTIDFPPNKLKQGFGEQALFVIDTLCDEALRSINFEWHSPIAPMNEDNDDDEIEDEDAEVDIDRVEEDMAGDYSEEEEEDILHIDEIMGTFNTNKDTSSNIDHNVGFEKPEQILSNQIVNAEEWRLEVERVAPLLKVSINFL